MYIIISKRENKKEGERVMRTPKQIAEDIFYNRDNKAKEELEKMMGCKFEDMTPEQRRLGCAALSAFDGVWNR